MKNSKKTWECTREIVFERLDRRMREDKLYLDYSMTLPKLSEMTGTNRTYASRAICEKYKSFREYINGLRVEHILADVQEKNAVEPEGGDPDEKETGCTYRKILRRRNRSK